MKKSLITLAITAATAAGASQAMADNFNLENSGHWIVRGGAAEVMPIPQETKVKGEDSNSSDKYKTKEAFTGALSLTYLITPHIGFQLSTTLPASLSQDYKGEGVNIGEVDTLKYQQTALTAQYYFMPNNQWQPYVGLGVAYNDFDAKVTSTAKAAGSKTSVDNKFSPIAEAGIDYYINTHWLVNASLSYTTMNLKAKNTNPNFTPSEVSGKFDFSPVVARINVGYRF